MLDFLEELLDAFVSGAKVALWASAALIGFGLAAAFVWVAALGVGVWLA